MAALGVVVAAQAAGPDLAKVKAQLEKNLSGVEIGEVSATPVPGLFEAIINDQVTYLTEDGHYMVRGDIYDRQTSTNLSELSRSKIRLEILKGIDDDQTIVFGPKKAKHTINVFTDTSCGYCRKLHNEEVPKLTEAGVKVRYLLFPRAGLGSPGYNELQSIWCAKNPQEALTKAKQGEQVPEKTCDNPIAEHVSLAQTFGLRGTPLLVTDKGTLINGYRPADQLLQILESDK
jgi:thiol:disulfide interchange protein DsbC